ncbi:MAG: hypothetical protein WDM79_16940 [Terricaulis sp.]
MLRGLVHPATALEPPNAGLPSSIAGDFQTLVSNYFHDRSMTPEQARAQLATIFH